MTKKTSPKQLLKKADSPQIQINFVSDCLVQFNIVAFIQNVFALKNISNGYFDFNFVDNEFIMELNQHYLNHHGSTDIITFNLAESEDSILADIYISVEQAKINAETFKNEFDQEIKLLIVHGILHLLDFDDYTPKSQKVMFAEQRRILKMINPC